jgi:hypothetical protein
MHCVCIFTVGFQSPATGIRRNVSKKTPLWTLVFQWRRFSLHSAVLRTGNHYIGFHRIVRQSIICVTTTPHFLSQTLVECASVNRFYILTIHNWVVTISTICLNIRVCLRSVLRGGIHTIFRINVIVCSQCIIYRLVFEMEKSCVFCKVTTPAAGSLWILQLLS